MPPEHDVTEVGPEVSGDHDDDSSVLPDGFEMV